MGICRGAIVVGRGIIVLEGNRPGGNCPRWELSEDNCPGGNCPRTINRCNSWFNKSWLIFGEKWWYQQNPRVLTRDLFFASPCKNCASFIIVGYVWQIRKSVRYTQLANLSHISYNDETGTVIPYTSRRCKKHTTWRNSCVLLTSSFFTENQ